MLYEMQSVSSRIWTRVAVLNYKIMEKLKDI